MRTIAILALPLLATSCAGSRWDGIYQILLTFQTWSCSADTELYDPGFHAAEGGQLSVRHTAADSMVVSFGNLLMAGPHEGSSFEVSSDSGFTDSSCDRYEYHQSYGFKGSFTDDLGIEGTVTITETEIREGCATGNERNETCTVVWNVAGFLIENHDDQHLGRAQWGYTPSTSY